jgi:uncharacterized protein YecE (DUF72 family)
MAAAVIGTAGWSIPADTRHLFPAEGTALQRYAARFAGVEINSSFHRAHRPSTWARWAESVPDGFRFAVKVPKAISHRAKLSGCAEAIAAFAAETAPLGAKRAILLLQLPPSLAFDAALFEAVAAALRGAGGAALACEPRHPSWFEAEAEALLARLEVAWVAADPAPVPAAAEPGGWRGFSYFRLHGSPVMYRSRYAPGALAAYAAAIRADLAAGRPAWCMFDNTASSAATGDALALQAMLASAGAGDKDTAAVRC